MSENKRYKNKLSRFEEEREELKKVKNEKAEKERVKKETEILKEELKARRALREKQEAGREENELTENDDNLKDDDVKDGKIYSPVARDVEFLEDLVKDVLRHNEYAKKEKRIEKRKIVIPVVGFMVMLAAGICLSAGIELPALIIAVAGGAGAIIAVVVGLILIAKVKNKKPAFTFEQFMKNRDVKADKIKYKLTMYGNATAAKITSIQDLGETLDTDANTLIRCKIEYSYCDEDQIARRGCYEGEIPPFFLDNFKAEGILPVIFIKGTGRILTHFPEKRAMPLLDSETVSKE